MTLTRLKAKNQLTLPQAVVNRLHLGPNEFFQVDIRSDCIRLVPVMIEPRYTPDELKAIDNLVEAQKGKAKVLKPGREFAKYVRKITR